MSPRFAALLACCLAGLLVLLPWRGVDAVPSTSTADQPTAQEEPITVEMLRLAVPAALRHTWLKAEAELWKPWLEQQPAFLGRDIYWDEQQEEGLLFIRWRSQQAWKAIADEALEPVQADFVAAINRATGGNAEDPIPLISASQLLLLANEIPPSTPATEGSTAQEPTMVKMLRQAVPATLRDAWLSAQVDVWKPWLKRQPAFLGRDIYWDEQQEEGLLFIRWRSQKEWEAITDEEVEPVQTRFVAAINKATGGKAEDPIPPIATNQLLLLVSETPPIHASHQEERGAPPFRGATNKAGHSPSTN